jgi:hypothetical protein
MVLAPNRATLPASAKIDAGLKPISSDSQSPVLYGTNSCAKRASGESARGVIANFREQSRPRNHADAARVTRNSEIIRMHD